jgi:hypothetical protein
MAQSVASGRLWRILAPAVLIVAAAPGLGLRARAQVAPAARQVTIFAVIATPGSNTIDPKLAAIASHLRDLAPNHGFKLLDVQSKQLSAGQAVRCELGHGWTATTALVQPLNQDGKILLRCTLAENEVIQHQTLVATPANQLFFWDRPMESGRLLVGVGAR